MKRLLSSTAMAAAVVLCGLASGANATTVSISENYYDPITNQNAPLYFPVAPDSSTPTFVLSTSGSISGVERSPYETNTDAFVGAAYSVLAPGGQVGPATATYNIAGNTIFALLWGSPDDYNHVTFYNGINGTGGAIATYSKPQLACSLTTCDQLAWDVVTFTAAGGTFGSVVLTDDGTAAFEYGLRVGTNASEAPLPAALWLFGTVIAGTAGASRIRRRRQLQLA